MNKKSIKYIITSLVVIGCLSTLSRTIIAADTSSYSINNLESSIFYAHNDNSEKNKDNNKKDKNKHFDLFNERNFKYLSSTQKKELLELKKCKDNGEKLSTTQEETIHSIIDCIIKGKLGNEKYEDFKCLMEKKKSNQTLTDEEDKTLKNYEAIIDGSRLSSKEILNQFLR